MEENQISPFEVLGVKPGCTKKELRDAYKSLLLVTHPDKHGGDISMVKMVMEAYEMILKYHISKVSDDQPVEYKEYNPKYSSDLSVDQLDSELQNMLISNGQLDLDKFNKIFTTVNPAKDDGYQKLIDSHSEKNFNS